jgi:hypothetical protein
VDVDILRLEIPCVDPLFTKKKTDKNRVQEADLGDEVVVDLERLEASSVHASHKYRVQEAELGDQVEAELERLEVSSDHASYEYRVQEADLGDEVVVELERPLLFTLLMSTVFRRLTT